jgi:DNA-binding phage protein
LSSPEERMWAAVLHRAFKDMTAHKPETRESAIGYLTKSSKGLSEVCEMAGVNMDSVIKAARHLKELDDEEGMVYLNVLMKDEDKK